MEGKVNEYVRYLEREEKSVTTCRQYRQDVLCFLKYVDFIEESELTKEMVLSYKEYLQTIYKATSVNAKIAALNSFFSFLGRNDLKVCQLKIQHTAFCSKEKELSKAEYLRLIKAAKEQKNEKLSLLVQTICGTGIRVSELKFITAEAVRDGEASIQLKGKTRVILISGKLRKMLHGYMNRNGIVSGPVFITRNGKPLDRSNIWKKMKELCKDARVEKKKVFPHNLRHLFARTFYSIDKDIAKLADILGHTSVNTTRIYIISSGQEHRRRMDALGLVI